MRRARCSSPRSRRRCAVVGAAPRRDERMPRACRSASPSPARGCSRPRARQRRVPARLPEALHRRRPRRRAASRAIDVGFVGGARQPGQPRHHDDAHAVFLGQRPRTRPGAAELPAAHRLHPASRRRPAHADGVPPFPPGKPTIRAGEEGPVAAGAHARSPARARAGERLDRRDARGRLLRRHAADRQRSRRSRARRRSAVHAGVVSVIVRPARSSAVTHDRAGRLVCAVRHDLRHPLLLLSLLVIPLAFVLYRLARAAADAVRRSLHERRRARVVVAAAPWRR